MEKKKDGIKWSQDIKEIKEAKDSMSLASF
jgi:hypothetical protein